MKSFLVRTALALCIAGTLALSAPMWASAGSPPSKSASASASALRTYDRELAAYRASRNAIQLTFRASVASARATYAAALSVATSASERSTAQQAMVTAIIQAASARSAALTALGGPPVKP
jgi:hypothetical protein